LELASHWESLLDVTFQDQAGKADSSHDFGGLHVPARMAGASPIAAWVPSITSVIAAQICVA